MSGVRAQQKQKTRQALIEAAFNQLSADHSFSNLSLREVAREAGIAPTSFYRHFKDMNELGLTMVDEAGLTLRQLMRQARRRIASGGSIITTSVVTFMEFIDNSSNQFRLLLRERSGTSKAFRAAVAREIKHFILELAHYLESETPCDATHAYIQAEAMVTLVFNAGAEALDIEGHQRDELVERVIWQLRYITRGANNYVRENKNQEKV
ncbi:HTH-type transcriptional repressor FabR [Pseudoalteromonas shioyasakiensis]|uniref:HTH-type transcriptional repressor FabR n=1 Tax=Pseudoalteromonas shioyasakiensis TaxID=1190813 RepID=UPI00211835D6|nr:HTH-type transcriptional repressor FabR [Pseudoalteromonas shioyasakiensis]MCQ8879896.1 HTH-type transcriptional repressor FabR [Pseudoalteromonas shioyasakiensis]